MPLTLIDLTRALVHFCLRQCFRVQCAKLGQVSQDSLTMRAYWFTHPVSKFTERSRYLLNSYVIHPIKLTHNRIKPR